jgi:Zn-finger nucleic acid-binding protein
MKSSSEIVQDEVQLELKYCERCGGLWLRPVHAADVFCARCAPEMAELPAPVGLRPKKKKRHGTQGTPELHAVIQEPVDLNAGGLA